MKAERLGIVLDLLEKTQPTYDPTNYIIGKAMFAYGVAHNHCNKDLGKMFKILNDLCTDMEKSGNRFKLLNLTLILETRTPSGGKRFLQLFAESLEKKTFESLADFNYQDEEIVERFKELL